MIYNHAPENYVCPICLGAEGAESGQTLIRSSDIIYKDNVTMAFIASYFIGKNLGHVIVVPLKHYEHLYDLPEDVGQHLFTVSKNMALAMKRAYGCEGITTQQNNEPVGGQHALHYHVHLFPRYKEDNIFEHMMDKRETTVEERLPFAEKMREALKNL